jgi:hypothetical protein
MNEKPTAVIRGASLGALRNGRYATRSIITLSVPDAIIATTRMRRRPGTSPNVPVATVNPSVPYRPAATNEPIMKTSPWAKLISSMIPYTSVYPTATSAQIAPFESPSTRLLPRRLRSPCC